MWKLCLSTKFPHQEITWNYGSLREITHASCTLAINNVSVAKYETEGDIYRYLITLDFSGYSQTSLETAKST